MGILLTGGGDLLHLRLARRHVSCGRPIKLASPWYRHHASACHQHDGFAVPQPRTSWHVTSPNCLNGRPRKQDLGRAVVTDHAEASQNSYLCLRRYTCAEHVAIMIYRGQKPRGRCATDQDFCHNLAKLIVGRPGRQGQPS
jgi:hypothetical protein